MPHGAGFTGAQGSQGSCKFSMSPQTFEQYLIKCTKFSTSWAYTDDPEIKLLWGRKSQNTLGKIIPEVHT
jgi:hypothetical protein